MKRFLKFLSAALPFLVALIIQYIVWDILVLMNDTQDENIRYLYSAAAILACGIVFFFWYRFEIKGEIRGSVKNLLNAKSISFFVILGLGCQLFFSGGMSLLTPYFVKVFSEYSSVLNKISSGSDIMVFLLVVFIAPVSEELIFRGVILRMANRSITFLGANILQAMLFGIYHGNLVQGVYAALIGFLLGYIYYKYRSIVAPILLHMLINSSAYLIYLIPEALEGAILIIVTGSVCILIGLIAINPLKQIALPILEDAVKMDEMK